MGNHSAPCSGGPGRAALLALLVWAAPARAAGPLGTWTGDYTCRKGGLGLTLTLARSAREWEGHFHFYSIAGQPPASEGRFVVRGPRDVIHASSPQR